jgi:hypothetical protein
VNKGNKKGRGLDRGPENGPPPLRETLVQLDLESVDLLDLTQRDGGDLVGG